MDTDDFAALLGFPIGQPALETPTSEQSEDNNSQGEDANETIESSDKTLEVSDREGSPLRPDAGSQRPARRRARRACVACHKRKVRCDVLSRGCTCTNCRLDGLTCVLRNRNAKRRRKPPKQPDHGNANMPIAPITERATEEGHSPTQALGAPDLLVGDASLQQALPGLPTSLFDSMQPADTGGEFIRLMDSYNTFDLGNSNMRCDMMFSYYDFIEAEPFSHLAPEDFKFLDYKGCFYLPTKPILDELVREYFLHVHPALPIIDEREFWAAYSSTGPQQRKISLFVFRAMLFTSCAFASDQTIQRMGFRRAIDARTWMYRRAKLLYDFNTTTDPIVLAQGTLMLTYYCSDREPIANTIWLQLAIQYAYQGNVPGYEEDTGLSDREHLERKRLWWCLILRDRILPLGVRRPIQITDDPFGCSRSRLTEDDLEHEFASSLVYDRDTKRQLARLLLAQLDLAILLTDIMPLIYPTKGLRTFDNLGPAAVLSMSQELKLHKMHLELWSEDFERHYDVEFSKQHQSLTLFRGLTQIYHHSARVALCQHESFLLQAMQDRVSEKKMKQLGSTLHAGVIIISETVRQFVQMDVVRYIPVSVAAYIALPILLNSLDVKSAASARSRTSARCGQLRILHEAMSLCLDRYDGTSSAQAAISRSIEAGRIELEDSGSRSTCVTRSSYATDWFEVFVSQPSRFLRIAMSLDISLSKGRQIQAEDLPQRLLATGPILTSTEVPPTELEQISDSISTPSKVLEEQDRRFELDFLNFDSLSP